MGNRTIWNGTVEEAQELCEILKRNCECGPEQSNTSTRCPPHAMLLSDQRALDGLLFVRHIARRLVREEFDSAVAA